MSTLLALFRPAPHLPEIEDEKEVAEKYRYWRFRIIYSMFVGYSLYYFTRKSFTYAVPGLIADLHFSKSELGFLASVLSISYGMSKFASGILSDRSNPRYFMAFGLMMTGVINICFGMSSSLTMFALFWGLNGWFQGFGWPPCARFLTHWYSQSERGSWWSSWSVSHNTGAFLIPWIVGAALQYLGWRWAMYIPGIICIMGSLFLINRLRDTPQSLGLPPIEKFRNDYPDKQQGGADERELSTREILWEHVLRNKFIWLLAAAYFFVYILRIGINDWTALYLIEAKGYTRLGANGTVSLFEVGGFCGTLSAGWSSDYFFGARRGPVNVMYASCILIAFSLFYYSPEGYGILDSAGLFLLGFSIFGPQMLIGVHAAEVSHKKAAATATGFVGWMAYMGAAVAGYPLGKIAQDYGWNGFFMTLAACAVFALLLLLPLWSVRERKIPETAKAEFA
ncbi:MAG: MFS transporter [Chlamydiales bacterium]|nr:phosphoglycerate transporter protein PgtP [Chlamydiia bacterium]MCP5506926.1 MFS transporter [Chlamydiales bacterium]